jgi:hypothetical protein
MTVRIVSFEAQVKAAIQAQLAGNLEDAINHYHEKLRDEISTQGPPRSTPGSPPHKDTGYLHDQSLSNQVDAANLVAREGSDAPYAAELEVGGLNRPFFIPVLLRESDEIARLICKP